MVATYVFHCVLFGVLATRVIPVDGGLMARADVFFSNPGTLAPLSLSSAAALTLS